jgi:hypothetical protein
VRIHKVKQGESIYHIARKNGVRADQIWELAENQLLRDSRRRKDLLFEGDLVHVPDIRIREEEAATENRHVFRRKTYPLMEIRLRLLFEDKPRKFLSCRLIISDIPGPPLEMEAKTDGNGLVEFDVPLSSESGLLRIGEDEMHRLMFNHLDPVKEVTGVQQRLANLGFFLNCNGQKDELTRTALRKFQRKNKIAETGEFDDDDTLNALEAEYGT